MVKVLHTHTHRDTHTKKTTNRTYRSRPRDLLAHAITEVGQSKFCRAGGRPREELMLQLQSEGHLLVEFSLPQGESVFFPWGPLNRARPMLESNLLYSKSTD